jgi:hypothetical protein
MCLPSFKVFNLVTGEGSVLENKDLVSCARTALLVSALSQRNGCSPARVTSQEITAEQGNVRILPHLAVLGEFAAALPEGCPLLHPSHPASTG